MIDTMTLFLLLCAFVAGYVVARLDSIYTALSARQAGAAHAPQLRDHPAVAAVKKQRQEEIDRKIAAVTIDNSTFVAPVNTANIQKVTDIELGTTTKQADTLDQAVSKLAQLKGQ